MKMLLTLFLFLTNVALAQETFIDLRERNEHSPSMNNIDAVSQDGDFLYVNSHSSLEVNQGIFLFGGVFKVSKSTKKTLWKYRPQQDSLVGKPALYRDLLLVGSTTGFVHVISRKDGKLIKRIQTKTPQNPYECCNTESSILIVGDMGYYAAEKLYGIDLKTLEISFISTVSAYSNSARLKPIYKNNKVFFNCNNSMCAVDSKTGKTIWQRKIMDGFGYYNRIWGNPQFDTDGNILFTIANPVGIAKVSAETGETLFSSRFFSHFERSSGYSNIVITNRGYLQRTRKGHFIYTDKEGRLQKDLPIVQTMFMNFHNIGRYSFTSGFYGEVLALDNKTGSIIDRFFVPLEPTETITSDIFSDSKNIYIPISSGRIAAISLSDFQF